MRLKLVQVSFLAMIVMSGRALAATASPDLVPTGYTLAGTDALASRLINTKVFSGTTADAAEIGYVKDLVLDSNGKATAVILGMGVSGGWRKERCRSVFPNPMDA